MPKIILKSGYPSVKEASSDPAVNEAYIHKIELSRLRQRKYWAKQRAILQDYYRQYQPKLRR